MIVHSSIRSSIIIVIFFSSSFAFFFNQIAIDRRVCKLKCPNDISHRKNALYLSIEDIRDDLNLYLKEKERLKLPPLEIDDSNEPSPLEMFRPSGWYRDEAEVDLKKRADQRIPKYLHPLSYIELERHGFKKLVNAVMELGGPHEVGKMINLDWNEPIESFISDESKRPKREISYSLDVKGSLLLGGALDEKLSAAENMDLTKLKRSIDSKNTFGASEGNNRYNGEDYLEWRKNVKRKAVIIKPLEEKFSMSYQQRLFFVLMLFTTASAYGHATADIIALDKWGSFGPTFKEISQLLSTILCASSIFSAIASVIKGKEKNRNPVIWAVKGFLGGPISYAELSSLDVFPGSSTLSSTNDSKESN
jgi:hypothetical protein